jgi:hypothetical protein
MPDSFHPAEAVARIEKNQQRPPGLLIVPVSTAD